MFSIEYKFKILIDGFGKKSKLLLFNSFGFPNSPVLIPKLFIKFIPVTKLISV